jgi:hypothetical protein
MPRGGARPGSGPAPSLDALKRVRDGKEWVRLPQRGLLEDDVPLWPAHLPEHRPLPEPRPLRDGASDLQREQHEDRVAAYDRSVLRAHERNEAERAYWCRLWSEQPQAHVWRADGTEDVVALFVRTTLEAAEPGGTTSARTLVKQLASDLLLNTAALHSARYVIDRTMEGQPAMPDAGAQPHVATGTGGAVPTRSIRDGLHIVPPVDDDEPDE